MITTSYILLLKTSFALCLLLKGESLAPSFVSSWQRVNKPFSVLRSTNEKAASVGGGQPTTKLPFSVLEARRLKKELIDLADRTDRGFQANSQERKQASQLITELAQFNPTKEPARVYYKDKEISYETAIPSISGKWTLLYTDAPDITSLQNNVLATLGRIGQECSSPYIKNVIEWKRPDWAASLPLAGSQESRILQKVVTEASASPDQPMKVDLELAGFEVDTDRDPSDRSLPDSVRSKGLIAGLVESQPLNVNGPLNAPFGSFEVLYLDEELRVVRTNQNYLAANVRVVNSEDEWF